MKTVELTKNGKKVIYVRFQTDKEAADYVKRMTTFLDEQNKAGVHIPFDGVRAKDD